MKIQFAISTVSLCFFIINISFSQAIANKEGLTGKWSSLLGNTEHFYDFKSNGVFERRTVPFTGTWKLINDGTHIELLSKSHEPIQLALQNFKTNMISFVENNKHIMLKRAQSTESVFENNTIPTTSVSSINEPTPVPNSNNKIMEEMPTLVEETNPQQSPLEATSENISKKWYVLKQAGIQRKGTFWDHTESTYLDCYYEFTDNTRYKFMCHETTSKGFWFPKASNSITISNSKSRWAQEWKILYLTKDLMEFKKERDDYKWVLTTHPHGTKEFKALSDKYKGR